MTAAVSAISQEVPMVSAKYIRKAMKRGSPVFLMLVRPAESESAEPVVTDTTAAAKEPGLVPQEKMDALLSEFPDVLPATMPGGIRCDLGDTTRDTSDF